MMAADGITTFGEHAVAAEAPTSGLDNRVKPRRALFAPELEWQFSLMPALDVVFLFVAVPVLSAGEIDRNVVILLQFILASTAVALIAKSSRLRIALAAGSEQPRSRGCRPA